MTQGAGSIDRERGQILAAVVCCFFLSGATGLVYEVIWVRMLALVFGHTVLAVTTVLTAFMAGLGAGSYLAGQRVDGWRKTLPAYGILEIVIGAFCLVTPLLFSGAEAIYIRLFQWFEFSYYVFSMVQFLVIFAILVVPTAAMGATLPVLSRFFVREAEAIGERVGLLYALNTFGAVLGSFAAGFYLIPTMGLRTTLYLGATVNIGIGVLVLVFDRHLARLDAGQPAPKTAPRQAPLSAPEGYPAAEGRKGAWAWVALVGLAFSGAASMIYEVAWTRALALIIGTSTYAFSTMLVSFLSGITLGGWAFSRLWGRRPLSPASFGLLELGIGLSALATTAVFERMPELFLRGFQISQAHGFILAVQFSLSLLAMLIPTILIGATFPCVVQIVTGGLQRVGSDVGKTYSLNTLGAIVGSYSAGFILIPLLGIQATLKVATATNLAIAIAAFGAAIGRLGPAGRGAFAAAVLALPLAVWIPPWDKAVMTSGVAIYGNLILRAWRGDNLKELLGARQILYYKDGMSATVTVVRVQDHTVLKVNGKTDAGNGADMHTQLMSGHLPAFLHPEARRALVIGLGSGVTVGAALQHPLEAVDVVEIEPAVVEASHFFARENRRALADPRVRLRIGDGRNFLLGTRASYDVIISEPSNPWISGMGNLFSREFFQLAAGHLRPDGLMVQWVQGYSLFPEDFKMVVRTFRSVFPYTTVWNTVAPDFLLIGSKRPLTMDMQRLSARYADRPTIREDLARIGMRSPWGVLADFVLGDVETARFSRRAALNTDDLPLLEFSAPRSLYAETIPLNQRVIRAYRQAEFPRLAGVDGPPLGSAALRHELALTYLDNGLLEQAREQLAKALESDPDHIPSLLATATVRLQEALPLQAEMLSKKVLKLDPRSFEARMTLAAVYESQQMFAEVEKNLAAAAVLRPDDKEVRARLGELYVRQGRFAEGVRHYEAGLARFPDEPRLLGGLARAYLETGKVSEAIGLLQRAIERAPDVAFLHAQMAHAHALSNRFEEAIREYRVAQIYDPKSPDSHVALARIHAAKGEGAPAVRELLEALRLDPTNRVATQLLEGLRSGPRGRAP